MNGHRTATEALVAKMKADHAAEVERLTAELQMHKLMRHEACVECGKLAAEIDQYKIDVNELVIERDAAVAAKERVVEALQWFSNVDNYMHPREESPEPGPAVLCYGMQMAREAIAGHAPATKGEGDE